MCIVSLPVKSMSNTKIFTSINNDKTRQIVIYSNSVNNINSKNAMILPVPNPQSLKFHNLTKYKYIFSDCDDCFIDNTFRSAGRGTLGYSPQSRKSLRVFDVGSYNVSVANSLDDLNYINADIFDVDDNCIKLLNTNYADNIFGFIICQLKTGNNEYHPLGYSHDLAPKIFIPTKHYHGHLNEKIADDWDHSIYIRNIRPGDYSSNSRTHTWNKMDIKTQKIDFDFGPIELFSVININGRHENEDIYLPLQNNVELSYYSSIFSGNFPSFSRYE